MIDPVGWLEALNRAVGDGAGEILITVAVISVVVGLRYLARLWFTSDRSRSGQGSRTRVAVSGIVTVLSSLGVVALIGVWGLFDPLASAYRELELGSLGGEIVLSTVLLGAAYSFTSFIGRVIEEVARTRAQISDHHREIVYRLTQVTLYTIVGLTVVTLFTDNIGSLLVGAGFLGIVVGMAARQTLSAVIAGFVLMFSKPFEIGDWVEVGDNEGIVTRITIVNTCLQTFDGEYVMIPNDTVSSQPILNRTQKGRLRIEIEVGVDYSVRPNRAAKIAVTAVDDLSIVSMAASPEAVIKDFGDSAVLPGVRAWVDNQSVRKMWRARTAVVDTVYEAFDREGIEIPFPQRTVSRREGGVGAEAGDGTGGGIPATDGFGGMETS